MINVIAFTGAWSSFTGVGHNTFVKIDFMTNSVLPGKKHTIKELADILCKDYYDLPDTLCDNTDAHIQKLVGDQLFSEHIRHGNYLVAEVKDFTSQRRQVYVPYIFELEEKNTTGHNCTTCSGGCDMQHNLRLLELTSSHKKIYNTANEVLVQLSETSGDEHAAEKLERLRNEIALIRNTLSQLVELETTSLLPKIKEAQKNINAHS